MSKQKTTKNNSDEKQYSVDRSCSKQIGLIFIKSRKLFGYEVNAKSWSENSIKYRFMYTGKLPSKEEDPDCLKNDERIMIAQETEKVNCARGKMIDD